MTIAAAYLTSEGVVLGADSLTTIERTHDGATLQLLDHAQKVFELGQASCFGVCTWGGGAVGSLSHRTVIARAADRVNQGSSSVADVAKCLVEVVNEALVGAQLAASLRFGYFVGGHDIDRTPRCCRVGFGVFEGKLVSSESWFQIGQSQFEGAPDYFARLFKGFAVALPNLLLTELRRRNPELPPSFEQSFSDAFREVSASVLSAGYADLPLREAIDYIHTYLYTTVKGFKFRFGVPLCGGPIEIGYVSTDRHFRWACHKQFNSAIEEHLRHVAIP
jgi:hypothetical protein